MRNKSDVTLEYLGGIEVASIGVNPKDLMGAKKPDLTLVPASAMIAIADAMSDGVPKYGLYNWRDENKPVQHRTYIAAAIRHLYQYLDGEDNARDSGKSHLAHALAGIAILNDAISLGTDVDDRPTKGAASDIIDRLTSK